MKAVQSNALLTRKLTVGALITSVVTEVWGRVMADTYPPLSGPEMSMLMGVLAGWAVAWFIKDKANWPVSE